MRSRWWIRSAAFAVIAALSTRAAAEEHPTARLEYVRGPGTEPCPDEAELKSAVAARLGYDPFVTAKASRPPRVVSVRLSRQGSVLRGRFEMRDEAGKPSGSREIESPDRDCNEVIASLAVAVAIGIDPLSLTRATPPASVPDAVAPVVAPAPPPAAPPPAPAPAPEKQDSAPIRLRGSAGTIVSFGAAPSTDVGLTVQVGAGWRAISLGLEGRADFPVSKASVDGGGSVSASLLLGTLVPCVHHGILAACALGTFGALRAEGEGVTSPLRDTKFYAAAGARIALEIPVSSVLAVRVHGDALATLTQITLRLNDRDVWTTPSISGGLGVALLATF